jgi:putative endonuclease
MWNVYIIKSKAKKWYYVGSTNRLLERLNEHNKGKVKSTRHYLPFEIVFTKEFDLEKEARKYERLLKDKRIEKEKIIKSVENK